MVFEILRHISDNVVANIGFPWPWPLWTPERSISIGRQVNRGHANSVFAKLGLLLKYGLKQDPEKSLRCYPPRSFYQHARSIGQSSYHVSTFCPWPDRREEALDWPKNAVNRGFINYPLMAEKTPGWPTSGRAPLPRSSWSGEIRMGAFGGLRMPGKRWPG